MLAKTALLIVSNPKKLSTILPLVQQKVKNTLYIQLLSALADPFGCFHSNLLNSWPKYSQTIHGIYSQAAQHCNNLDVRILLSGLKYSSGAIQTKAIVDLVIFDKNHTKSDIDDFIRTKIANIEKNCDVITLDSGDFESLDVGSDSKVYKHSVLGGTFDRLHLAHKLLLSEAVLRSETKVTVGVTQETMLASKTLSELIQDLPIRMQNVSNFLKDICPELSYDIVPISDPFGPSIVDPTMQMIVVSDETLRGGQKINQIRVEKQLNELDIVPIKLIDEPHPNPYEETKISSSTTRMRLLGTLLQPIERKNIPKQPYVVGLTGGVASGKTGVAHWLQLLGAEIINCDLIGHSVYKAGKPCFDKIVDCFGPEVVGQDGEVDRKVLGSIVFRNADELKRLNELVWPFIAQEVAALIKACDKRVVVVEAAVLLVAGWQEFCHEVWATFVPRSEAVKRLISRNGLTEEQASLRIDSQPTNKVFVESANVVFCSLWEPEYTKEQVDRAWELLQRRIL